MNNVFKNTLLSLSLVALSTFAYSATYTYFKSGPNKGKKATVVNYPAYANSTGTYDYSTNPPTLTLTQKLNGKNIRATGPINAQGLLTSARFYTNGKLTRVYKITYHKDGTSTTHATFYTAGKADGRGVSQLNEAGQITSQRHYNNNGKLVVSITSSYNANGSSTQTQIEYDSNGKASGRTVFQDNEAGQATSQRYFSNGQLVSSSTFSYNANGSGTGTQIEYGSNGKASGRTVFQFNKAGQTTSVRHYSNGQLVSSSTVSYNANGSATQTQIEYGSNGKADGRWVVQFNKARQTTSQSHYNNNGQLTHSSTFSYNANGSATQTQIEYGSNGKADGRWVSQLNEAGQATSLRQYSNGQLVSSATNRYNANGSATRTQIEYGSNGKAEGRWVSQLNEAGQTTSQRYFSNGQLVSSSTFSYNANGSATQTQIEYGSNGKADGRWVYQLNKAGQTTSQRHYSNGQLTSSSTFQKGQILTSNTYSDGQLVAGAANTYNAKGRLVSSYTYTRSKGKRVHISYTANGGYTEKATFYTNGKPNGQITTITYDPKTDITTQHMVGKNNQSITVQYNTKSNLNSSWQKTYHNGKLIKSMTYFTNGGPPRSVTLYSKSGYQRTSTYRPDSRSPEITYKNAKGQPISQQEYVNSTQKNKTIAIGKSYLSINKSQKDKTIAIGKSYLSINKPASTNKLKDQMDSNQYNNQSRSAMAYAPF